MSLTLDPWRLWLEQGQRAVACPDSRRGAGEPLSSRTRPAAPPAHDGAVPAVRGRVVTVRAHSVSVPLLSMAGSCGEALGAALEQQRGEVMGLQSQRLPQPDPPPGLPRLPPVPEPSCSDLAAPTEGGAVCAPRLLPGPEGHLRVRGDKRSCPAGTRVVPSPAVVFTPHGRDGKETASQLLCPYLGPLALELSLLGCAPRGRAEVGRGGAGICWGCCLCCRPPGHAGCSVCCWGAGKQARSQEQRLSWISP